jgi:hypothetical protein
VLGGGRKSGKWNTLNVKRYNKIASLFSAGSYPAPKEVSKKSSMQPCAASAMEEQCLQNAGKVTRLVEAGRAQNHPARSAAVAGKYAAG